MNYTTKNFGPPNRSNRGSTSYNSWQSMRQRTSNTKSKDYFRYGAVGITCCERWRSFDEFWKDMGPKPQGCSLDRIDNSKGYSPENCRWSTAREQCNNKTNNVLIEDESGKSKTISELARESGVHKDTIRWRLLKGKRDLRKKTTNKVFIDVYGFKMSFMDIANFTGAPLSTIYTRYKKFKKTKNIMILFEKKRFN